MLSDDELKELKTLIARTIRKNSGVLNGKIDPDQLPSAIAEAVADAISYYDQRCH